jgi:hypothetical protein
MNISNESDLPLPILLNCWKHHAGFIKEQIHNINPDDKNGVKDILPDLLTIGESQMDLYLGELSPVIIALQIKNQLIKLKVESIKDYKNWILNEGKEYKIIHLPDDSVWTLRIGVNEKRYVHIHPARNSIHTIRIRAITLKTAIIVLSWIRISGGLFDDLKIINKVRKEFLNQPPLKKVYLEKGLAKLFRVLQLC